jgi:predicted ABC-type exoprotein transport system permease subunit
MEPRVPLGNWSVGLQLLYQMRMFGIMYPFLANILEKIWYNEGERKKRSFIFIFSGKFIHTHIVFSFIVNDIIIISKDISHPFLLLWGGNALFQKILEALMVFLNLEALTQ